MTFDAEGTLIVADAGMDARPRIIGFKPDGTSFEIYPGRHQLPLVPSGKQPIRGPIGGLAAGPDKSLFVLHRDQRDRGVISKLDYSGMATTVVADLPAEGEHGLLDLVLNKFDGRLYFAIGSMTNAGVVGLDNWEQGWADKHPEACDIPAGPIKLLGYRFDTPNPRAGLFGGNDLAVTAPFQPFGQSNQVWVRPGTGIGKPTAAIYSVSPTGGDLRIEAHGIRCARGLAINDYGRLYATNQGMELRGTRPVKDDPDALLRVVRNTWYGWPDYSADLRPIAETVFQPPTEMILRTGYPELSLLIDHASSGLIPPDRRTLLQATFLPLSGAAKMDFVPAGGPFKEHYGKVIVALSGDRAPFATSGRKLLSPVGFKVVSVDVDSHQVQDFVYNVRRLPTSLSRRHPDALERPFDAKFAPDGSLYILDLGQLKPQGAKMLPIGRSGKILRMVPAQQGDQ